MAAGLAHLAAVHEALEDATRGLPEAAREAAAAGVLAAAGAVVMRAHMHAGAAEELLALRCLQPLVSRDGTAGGLCGLTWLIRSLSTASTCPPDILALMTPSAVPSAVQSSADAVAVRALVSGLLQVGAGASPVW